MWRAVLVVPCDDRADGGGLGGRAVAERLRGEFFAGAFLEAGLVDRILAFLSPVLLGAGAAAVEDAGVTNIAQALRFHRESVETLGPDLLLSLTPGDRGVRAEDENEQNSTNN